MKLTRTLALMLALLTLASCGGSGGEVEETTAADETTTEAVETAEFTPAPLDLGGKTIRCLTWTNHEYFNATEENGDVINDAIFRRNRTVEDLYNFTFEQDVRFTAPAEHGQFYSTLTASVMADDDAYQIAAGYGYQLAPQSLDGNFHNLLDSRYLDSTKQWWPDVTSVVSFGNKMTIAFGYFDARFMSNTYAMVFNQALAEEYKVGDVFGIVNDGKWTIDKLFELGALAKADLNGDGEMKSADDQFGVLFSVGQSADALLHSCEIDITGIDSSGKLTILPLSERHINVQQKMRDYLYGSDYVDTKGVNGSLSVIFKEGRALFYTASMATVLKLRDMEDDYGIIPPVKYDEAQENYHGHNSVGDNTALVVPITADIDEVGAVIEAFQYYGWKEVRPTYFNTALKAKGARNSESEAMLDLIFNSIIFEFSEVYSFYWGDWKSPSMALKSTLQNDSTELASYWAANKELFENKLAELVVKLS